MVFLIILMVFVFAFAAALTKVPQHTHASTRSHRTHTPHTSILVISFFQPASSQVSAACRLSVALTAWARVQIYEGVERLPENELVLDAFGSFGACMRTNFWALFGLVELENLTVTGEHANAIQALGEIVFGLYMVLVFILLINLLIAMISNTYQRIADDSDKARPRFKRVAGGGWGGAKVERGAFGHLVCGSQCASPPLPTRLCDSACQGLEVCPRTAHPRIPAVPL
jgi:hypothetical protein